jgi:hypothetical protein
MARTNEESTTETLEMYEETSSENITKTILLAVETQLLGREKEDANKKYTNLLADVHNWMTANATVVITIDYQKNIGGEVDGSHNLSLLDALNVTGKKDLIAMAVEKNKLKNDLE